MMARHIRQGDQVQVLAGDDKGRQGKVLNVIPKRRKVVVEGVNLHKKHQRPTQQNQQGGVIEKELPIDWSNVQPIADGKPTRVRFQRRNDGAKIRVAARTGEQIGPELKKPAE
jgi:large subunit ribosomal protein L24